MSRTWYPIIDYDLCINCGACFKKCRNGVYKLKDQKPVVVYKYGCVHGCHGCQKLCPAGSITYAGDNKNV